MGKIPEETMRELDDAYNAMMEEQRKMKAMEKDATEALRKVILPHYPEIYNLEAEGYKEIENVIWKAVDVFVTGVNHIANTKQAINP
jgi:hypothetical protein